MREAVERVKACLPYKMLLTRVFEAPVFLLKVNPSRNYIVMMSTITKPYTGCDIERLMGTG